ncbi:MAG: ADP-ribosyltransferase, partial [Eubacterium sp.]
FDMWLQRGCDENAFEKFLGLSNMSNLSEQDLQKFVGTSNTFDNFISSSVNKGSGFSSKPITMNIYAPKGTKMLYAEPFSSFGNGDGLNWDGINPQASFGGEAEMIIQRGATYRITKIEKTGYRTYIDVEVRIEQGYNTFQQDPTEWKGSKDNYMT